MADHDTYGKRWFEGPLSARRQDDAAGGDPGAHRRDAAHGHGRAPENTVGDANAEARAHQMSVECPSRPPTFLGDSYTFLDCPGSIEFVQDMRAALPAVDAAVVVCEADERKVPQLQLMLRELEERNIPRFLFLNKIDKADRRVRESLALLQPASRVPLLLRQIPIWKDEHRRPASSISRSSAPSSIASTRRARSSTSTTTVATREKEARFAMLEKLADYDDAADGATARGHRAAARQGVRRSRARNCATA